MNKKEINNFQQDKRNEILCWKGKYDNFVELMFVPQVKLVVYWCLNMFMLIFVTVGL